MAAYPLRIIHIVGIVAEWLVQYLKRTGHAVRIPKKDFYPVGNCAAGGQTGTEAWQPPLEARLLCYGGVQPGHGLSVFHVETSWTRGVRSRGPATGSRARVTGRIRNPFG
jgi:hypothetical protein